jgi:hypothetical protein
MPRRPVKRLNERSRELLRPLTSLTIRWPTIPPETLSAEVGLEISLSEANNDLYSFVLKTKAERVIHVSCSELNGDSSPLILLKKQSFKVIVRVIELREGKRR